MNTLNPGARWLYRWYGLCMFLPILIFIFIFSLAGIPASAQGGLIFLLVGAVSGFIALIFILIIIEIYARMSYNRFLYEITNEGIKIEQGIIWKKYTSIPYERVQNVGIERGIIARLFGFSTIQIETAGQSGYGSQGGLYLRFGHRRNRQYKSEGYLPAINTAQAEEMRAFIMKQIKHRHAPRQGV